jgi:predicted nucleic acid-binding protein
MTDATPQSKMKTLDGPKIYLDTFVFMDILSNEPDIARKAESYLALMKTGTTCVVSSILFAELAFHIKRTKGAEKAEEVLMHLSSMPLEIIPVTPDIAKTAGMLRAHYAGKIEKKLTYFDCIHLSTALAVGCSKFVTGDKGFRDIKELKMEIY